MDYEETLYQISPFDPPDGSLVLTVLAPNAFCDDEPNVVPVIMPTFMFLLLSMTLVPPT
jgi:hypothetical protein